MDEAMRPFFLGVAIPISCPLRGTGAGFAKVGILPSGGSPGLRWGWCPPGGHALPGALLTPLCGIFSACTGAAAAPLPAGWKGRSVPWLWELQLCTSLTPIRKPCCSDQQNPANGATKYFMWV